MATFPILSTGAVAQYPLSRGASYAVDVTRFLDGSEQRCLLRGRGLRRWIIQLDLLSEAEMTQIQQFFDDQQGNYESFTFTDPLTGSAAPNCRLANPTVVSDYLLAGQGRVALEVEETGG